MFFIFTSPGSWISPDSTTSTSGRLATSSADRSSGRATSVITQPGLTAMMSRTRFPAPEVAVTMRSMSPRCSLGVAAFDVVLETQQLCRLGRHQPQLIAGERQQPGADRPDGPTCAHHHDLSPDTSLVVELGEPELHQRLVRRPQGTGGAVAIASRDRQGSLLGYCHA